MHVNRLRRPSICSLLAPLCGLGALALLAAMPASATSPWMRSEREAYYATGLAFSTSRHYWDRSGRRHRSGCRTRQLENRHHFEYGLSYYHTLFLSVGLETKHCGGAASTGLGDLRVGVRGRRDPFRNGRTWEVLAILPTGYSRTERLRRGFGEPGIEAGIASLYRGQGMDTAHTWDWEYGAALRYWAGPPAPQFVGHLKWTWPRDDGTRRFLALETELALDGARPEPLAGSPGEAVRARHDLLRLRAGISRRLAPGWRLRLEATRTLWGRNTGERYSLGVVLSHHWQRPGRWW
ncbi:MAG: hypothetical protein D6721_04885 [Gammaproteobacteria bacterium]|nr:MAG: hypothetical protein D6721_04885 [Gammaproteobacteria bacterium]